MSVFLAPLLSKGSQLTQELCTVGPKRPGYSSPLLLLSGRILQQLQKDHVGVQAPDRRRFSSFDDALQRLLPYHVFQGAPPSQEEFSQGTSVTIPPNEFFLCFCCSDEL